MTERVRARLTGSLRRAEWWPTYPPRRLKDFYPRRPNGSGRSIALTFDDGPDPRTTPSVLEALASAGATATFFMCGVAVERNPSLAREVIAAGHAIGGHTWDHPELPCHHPDVWAYQVERCQDLLGALVGSNVPHFRPPRGKTSRALLQWLAHRQLIPVLWSAHGPDWSENDPDRIVSNVAAMLEPGSVVLLHDGCGGLLAPGSALPPGCHGDPTRTAAALPALLEHLKATSYRPVPLPRPAPGDARALYNRASLVPG